MNPYEFTEDADPHPLTSKDVVQLLAGLERQREDLGPIADELIQLLLRYRVSLPLDGHIH